MARKREAPSSLHSVRHEFFASLEKVCHEAGMMLTSVETVIQHGDLKPRIREALEERTKGLREALYGSEEPK